MGVKPLSLQMIPWCFQLMGGTSTSNGIPAPHPHSDPSPATLTTTDVTTATTTGSIQLIRTDGRVEVYHRPVSASELMSEHPRHLVCRSDAPFTIGQTIPSLPAGEQLQPGHAYFLLPVRVFPSVLSFVTLAASFARAASSTGGGGSSSAPALLQKPPFDVQKTPSGKLQIRVSEAFIERIRKAQDGGGGDGGAGGGRVCTTAALEKDYRQLVEGSRARQWKPKLETIRESAEMRRGRFVAVAAAVIALARVRWRRKANHRGRQRQRQQQKQQKQQREQQGQVEKLSVMVSSLTHKTMGKKVVACNL